MRTLCCLTGVLAPYVCCKTHLVDKGRIGFSTNAGHPSLMRPGWNLLIAPWNEFHKQFPVGVPLIEVGPVTIVRVPQARSVSRRTIRSCSCSCPGPRADERAVQIPQDRGLGLAARRVFADPLRDRPHWLCPRRVPQRRRHRPERRRYAINTPVFRIGPEVDVRQENMKFSKHQVMLDGGVTLECEGLLTYQIVDPVLLTKNMGADDVERALQDTTKAELAKVFASVQLEQLSGIRATEINQRSRQELDLLTAAAAGADKKHGGDAKRTEEMAQ